MRTKKLTSIIQVIAILLLCIQVSFAQKVEITSSENTSLHLFTTNVANNNVVKFSSTLGFNGVTGLDSDFQDMIFGTTATNTTGKLHLLTEDVPRISIDPGGNVGIGTIPDPGITSGTLQVNGQIKIVDGNQGAGKVLVSNANGLATWGAATSAPVTYQVGDFAQGGVVFWVSANAQHGKVVSIYDIKAVEWSWTLFEEIGAPAKSLVNGSGNTLAILFHRPSDIGAAKYCVDLAYGGYEDWYLPAKSELSQIYSNRTLIGNIAWANNGEYFDTTSSVFYWSSTENNAGDAWAQNFGAGMSPQLKSKVTEGSIRAIRAF
jgi:hypothetical protein